MSEQFLDVPERSAVPQQMSSAGVAEGVNGRVEPGSLGVIFDDAPDLRIGKTAGRDRQEKGCRVCDWALLSASPLAPIGPAHQLYPCRRDILFQPLRSGRGERHDPFTPALSFANAKRSAVEVTHIQAVKFAVPDAGCVESFEDAAVPYADRFFRVALLDYARDFGFGRNDRKRGCGLWQLEVFGDVGQHFIRLIKPFEEASDARYCLPQG